MAAALACPVWLTQLPGRSGSRLTPIIPEARRRVAEHRSYWLRGYRGILGLAYLTPVPVA